MTRTHEIVSADPAAPVHPPHEPTSPCLGPTGSAALVLRAFKALGGRWKLAIVFQLFAAPSRRFSELERAVEGVSQKMLAQRLRELERDGLVARTVHDGQPPHVSYALTETGRALHPALRALRTWSATL